MVLILWDRLELKKMDFSEVGHGLEKLFGRSNRYMQNVEVWPGQH